MPSRDTGVTKDQVDAVMRVTRALVGITAASIADLDDRVTVPQLRVMMMIATRGEMNLATVAAGLGVGAPNASRICDRLLKAGMVDRREDPGDRRHIALTVTPQGRALLERMNRHRRNAIRRALGTMTTRDRNQLVAALEVFADAVGEPLDEPRLTVL
jgi:DNA-binding MarR family transcriptional regulator